MQINLSINLAGSTGEATSKATETADTESASSFFAQMGQLWNPDGEEAETQDGEKPDAQKSITTGFDPISMMIGTTMLSLNPIKAEPASNPDLSAPTLQIMAESSLANNGSQEAAPEDIRGENSGKSGETAIVDSLGDPIEHKLPEAFVAPAMPDSSSLSTKQIHIAADGSLQLKAVAHPGLASSPGVEATEEKSVPKDSISGCLADEANSSPDLAKASTDAVTKLQPDLANESQASAKPQTDALHLKTSRLPESRNPVPDAGFKPEDPGFLRTPQPESRVDEFGKAPAPDELEAVPSASSESAEHFKAPDSPAMPEIRHIRSILKATLKSEPETGPGAFPPESAIETEPDYPLSFKPAPGASKDEAGSVDQPRHSRDSMAGEKLFSPEAPVASKSRITSASNSTDAGGAQPDREESRHPPGAQPIIRAKVGDGRTPPQQKAELPIANHSQETSSMLAADAARKLESGNFAESLSSSSTKIQSRELVFQLADQIRVQLRDGKSEIRIQLKPDILGRIEIKAETTLSGIAARITTESGDVKTYLENNLQLLQQTLNDQGLRVDRIHVIVQDALDSRSSSGYGTQFGHAGSGRNGHDPDVSPNGSGSPNINPSDELNVDPQTWLALNPNSRFHTVA